MTIYFFTAGLFTLGVAGIALLPNLLRKLLAMNVMQVSVIIFFVAVAFKDGAGAPILAGSEAAQAADYMNPLPHTLMLTAIVVAVSSTGLALSLLTRIRRQFGTLNTDRLLAKLR